MGREMKQHHAYILPTQGENFGHSIYEALINGLPVIISDQTPWRNLEREAIGFDIALQDKRAFIKAIATLCEFDQTAFDNMTAKSLSYINRKLDLEKIKSHYIHLFH